MNLCLPAVFLPLLAAPAIGVFGSRAQGAIANVVMNVIAFGFTIGVCFAPGSGLIYADGLGMIFGVLTGFAGLTTALSNISFVWSGNEVLSLRRWRVYHAMCQVVLGSTLLGLYADNIGLLWVAVEGATIAATLGVSLPRTASGLEAAWKYFILGGVGIALALFGTMLVYLAAQPALGPGLPAMSFLALTQHVTKLDGSLLTLAFVFLAVWLRHQGRAGASAWLATGCVCRGAAAANHGAQHADAECRADRDFTFQALDAGEF